MEERENHINLPTFLCIRYQLFKMNRKTEKEYQQKKRKVGSIRMFVTERRNILLLVYALSHAFIIQLFVKSLENKEELKLQRKTRKHHPQHSYIKEEKNSHFTHSTNFSVHS